MIHVLTHYTSNWKEIADITVPVMQSYSEKHGYACSVNWVDKYDKYDGLYKLSQIMEICSDGDIAIVCDADILITNFNVKIEDFIKDGKDFYVAKGWNMGVFIVRITPASIKLINHLFFWIKDGRFNCEQDAFEFYMQMYLLSDATDIIQTVPHPSINSYLPHLYPEIKEEKTEQQGKWAKGHFCLHVPGLDLQKRLEILKEYSQYIVYE